MKNNKIKIKKYKKINNNVLTITLENGQIIDANIILTFKENGDQFIIYEIEEKNDFNEYSVVYGSKIDENNLIKPIENDEWPIVEKIFNEWVEQNDLNNESN